VLPYVFYTLALGFMEAGKASILAAGEPVAAMVFGFAFFAERPTALAASGLVLTTAALVVFSRPEKEVDRNEVVMVKERTKEYDHE